MPQGRLIILQPGGGVGEECFPGNCMQLQGKHIWMMRIIMRMWIKKKRNKSTKSFPGGGAGDAEMSEMWRCGDINMRSPENVIQCWVARPYRPIPAEREVRGLLMSLTYVQATPFTRIPTYANNRH